LKRCQFPKCRSTEIQITYLGKHLCGKHWIKISTLLPDKARKLLKLPQSKVEKPILPALETDGDFLLADVASKVPATEPAEVPTGKKTDQAPPSCCSQQEPEAQLLFFSETPPGRDPSSIPGRRSRIASKRKGPVKKAGRKGKEEEKTGQDGGIEQLELFLTKKAVNT